MDLSEHEFVFSRVKAQAVLRTFVRAGKLYWYYEREVAVNKSRNTMKTKPTE
jgi:hypothetical protein